MALLSGRDLPFARAVSRLAYCNPFLPERVEAEQQALGSEYRHEGVVWSLRGEPESFERHSLTLLRDRVEALAERLRAALRKGAKSTAEERALYDDLILYLLYDRNRDTFQSLLEHRPAKKVGFYAKFVQDAAHYFVHPTDPAELAHIFACFFQIRRAFHHIYTNIIGASMPAARLRATVWESIFTHDMRRYRRSLFAKMGDLATLITGPSGTGKELVAGAIGMSRYVPFDARTQAFAEEGGFHALNLSALSPTLIESELFGHRRGAFTGALEDRPGWLELCGARGAVFLDEIGELDGRIQVKLLRVLQSRVFQRIGETEPRTFSGKILAATNRDLAVEMEAGRFRRDFYYRICSDLVVTTSLQEQLRESPEDLANLVLFITRRVDPAEAESLAAEVVQWIGKNLGRDYAWPGNFRELEQCVRNVLIRREYRPTATAKPDLEAAMEEGRLTADQLLRRYVTLVYSRTGNYEETARRLMLDRRTVRAKVDPEFLKRLE